MSYLLRPTPELQGLLDRWGPWLQRRYTSGLDSGRSLVGVHVRLTDKIGSGFGRGETWLRAIPLTSYMGPALAWWRAHQTGGEEKMPRVYVASDDPRTLQQVPFVPYKLPRSGQAGLISQLLGIPALLGPLLRTPGDRPFLTILWVKASPNYLDIII